ncbi:hypothetical protein QYF36_021072 [Acer negundo]|nr:hypothetical protein QYF36_021072 [Acer negundo]
MEIYWIGKGLYHMYIAMRSSATPPLFVTEGHAISASKPSTSFGDFWIKRERMGCFACFDGDNKQQRKEQEKLASAKAQARAADAAPNGS